TNASAKIGQIRLANGKCGARQHATAILPEKHALEHRRDVDWRGVERQILRGSTGALNPVNEFIFALPQENRDPIAIIANAVSKLLKLRLEKFIFGFAHDLGNPRLETR